MIRRRFSLLIVACLFCSLGHAQIPTAGFSVDSVQLSTLGPEFLVFLVNTSSGNPSATTYVIHDSGYFPAQYQVFPNAAANTFLPFSNHPGPTFCNAFEISQIVSNASGADTATVTVNIGCTCTTTPLQYWLNVNHLGNGNIIVNAGSNDDSYECDIYSGPGGPPLGCPAISFSCTTSVPSPGSYPICALFSQGTCTGGGIVHCDTVQIQCSGPPQAGFSHSSPQNTVNFTDQSTGWSPNSWQWDFGDGSGSTLQNPSHTYSASGSYSVCLVVTDECGSDTICETVAVTVVGVPQPENVQFAFYPNPANASLRIEFGNALSVDGNMALLDLSGKLIQSQSVEIGEKTMTLKFTDVPSGLYLLEFRTDVARQYAKVLISR